LFINNTLSQNFIYLFWSKRNLFLTSLCSFSNNGDESLEEWTCVW